MDEQLMLQAVAARRSGERAALATVTHTRGHSPRGIGAKMLIFRDGRTLGTVGGGCGESEVRRRAFDVIDSGVPEMYVVDLMDDPAAGQGEICGGKMDVFIEPIG